MYWSNTETYWSNISATYWSYTSVTYWSNTSAAYCQAKQRTILIMRTSVQKGTFGTGAVGTLVKLCFLTQGSSRAPPTTPPSPSPPTPAPPARSPPTRPPSHSLPCPLPCPLSRRRASFPLPESHRAGLSPSPLAGTAQRRGSPQLAAQQLRVSLAGQG